MYLHSLFAVVAMTVLALGWLELSAAQLNVAARRVAGRYAVAGVERAQSALMTAIAAQVAAGNSNGPFVAPTAGPPLAACSTPSPCAFRLTIGATLGGATQSSADAFLGASAGNVVASNRQQNPGVGEQRLSATVSASVSNLAGAVLAISTRRLVLRTFAAPPYVALSAVDEPTAENSDVADFAGTCDGSAACGGVDNRIHALVRCVDVQLAAHCADAPVLPADTFADTRWQNANAQAQSWSR